MTRLCALPGSGESAVQEAIQAARPEQGRIQHVWSRCRAYHHHSCAATALPSQNLPLLPNIMNELPAAPKTHRQHAHDESFKARMLTRKGAQEVESRTLEALDPVQLCEKLVDDAVGHTSAVMTALGRYGIKLIEEQHTRSRRTSPPARQQQDRV
jgi:hypothetical protein